MWSAENELAQPKRDYVNVALYQIKSGAVKLLLNGYDELLLCFRSIIKYDHINGQHHSDNEKQID